VGKAVPQTLKDQITATEPYRYRLAGIDHAAELIRIIHNTLKKPIGEKLYET
jgi:hypothetical protein